MFKIYFSKLKAENNGISEDILKIYNQKMGWSRKEETYVLL